MDAATVSLLIALVLGSTGEKAAGLIAKKNGLGQVGNPLIGAMVSASLCQGMIMLGVLVNTQYIVISIVAGVSGFSAVLAASPFRKEQVRFSDND